MDCQALKRPWVGVLVFFCIAMVPSESCIFVVRLPPEALIRMVQVTLIKGNILQTMIEKAMKNGDNSKMIKGIKGLKIVAISIPKTLIGFIPKDELHPCVGTAISVAGKSFIGGQMTIHLVSELIIHSKISRSPKGKLILKVTVCKVVVKSCKTNLPSSMLPKIVNKFLDSTLSKVLPGVLCPAADMMMEKQMEAFEIMLAKKAIGIVGFILYEVAEQPVVHTTYISISIKIKVQKKNGEIIQSECDRLPDDMPPRNEKMSAVYLPASTLNGIMILLQPHLDTALSKVQGSAPTSDQLKQTLPNVNLPAGKQLKIAITHTESPKITMSSSASYITTYSEASFLDANQGNQILFMKMKHQCSVSFVIKNEYLSISLKQGSCRTLEVSSPAGDVAGAAKYTETVMDSWMSHAAGVLNKNQVPLPSIMNVTSTTTDAELSYEENMLVIQSEIQPYGEEQMAQEMKKQCNAIKL